MEVNRLLRVRAAELADLIGHAAFAGNIEPITGGTAPAVIAARLGRPDAVEGIAAVASACAPLEPAVAATYLSGFLDGFTERQSTAESVWTGPAVNGVPVRATLQALLGLIDGARRDLWLATYSAKPHPPLLDALRRALRRGVDVSIAIETLAGAGSAIAGAEPAAAFASLDGLKRYTWPAAARPEDAKLHAKLAIADARVLLVTSANFTTSGLERNLEAGLLVTGGTTPKRSAEHLAALIRSGALQRV